MTTPSPLARDDHGHDDHDHPHPHPNDDHGHDDHPHPHPNDDHGHGDHGHDDHGHGDHGHGDHGHGDHGHDHHHSHDDEHGHDHEHPTGLKGVLFELFKPHSHDSADSVDTALESNARGVFALKISLAGLMITAVLQVILVAITGSVALLADTVHNFSDALTAVPLWIAFILARRAANRRYTYGYRRAEDIAGLFIVGMILLSAVIAGVESINRLVNPHPITNPLLVIAAGVVGFLGNELVALYRIRVGKEIGSAALVADGYHARADGFTSLAVVIGAIGVMLGFPLADPIVGLLITVAILWVLKDAAAQVFGRLMDAVDPALVDRIERSAAATPGVLEVDSVRVRWIGHRLEASLHALVDCEISVAEGHHIAEEIRHRAFHDVSKLDAVLVHIDPCDHPDADHHERTRGHDALAPAFAPAGRGAKSA